LLLGSRPTIFFKLPQVPRFLKPDGQVVAAQHHCAIAPGRRFTPARRDGAVAKTARSSKANSLDINTLYTRTLPSLATTKLTPTIRVPRTRDTARGQRSAALISFINWA